MREGYVDGKEPKSLISCHFKSPSLSFEGPPIFLVLFIYYGKKVVSGKNSGNSHSFGGSTRKLVREGLS
ncbi:hypothetical protein CEE34_08405 [Candidatus Aerophobetes bacterium Ae_b3a]|nr:MAG: hypothetical protein CEE34_08405 [Candidatus Aerophobetes bacterium Ae_b3a]